MDQNVQKTKCRQPKPRDNRLEFSLRPQQLTSYLFALGLVASKTGRVPYQLGIEVLCRGYRVAPKGSGMVLQSLLNKGILSKARSGELIVPPSILAIVPAAFAARADFIEAFERRLSQIGKEFKDLKRKRNNLFAERRRLLGIVAKLKSYSS